MAKRVLIVENTQDYRQVLQEIVEGLGYQAEAVNRATEALKVINRDVISLILLDIKMPSLRGDVLLQYIRKGGKRIPVVAVSAYLTPEVLEVLRDNGVRQAIAKPFRVRRLAQAVRQALEEG